MAKMERGRLHTFLAKTPLRPMWRTFKATPPFSWGFRALSDMRQDRYYGQILPDIYNRNRTKPVDEKKVVFVENRLPELSNNFTLIYEDAKKAGYKVHVHLLRNTFAPRKKHEQNVARMIADIATAKYVFLCEASFAVACVDKRPETVITQLWHACGAFKKFGNSNAEGRFGPDKKQLEKHPLNAKYDYVTVSSPEIAWAYVEALGLEDRPQAVTATGTSRTDIFFDPQFLEAAKERVYEAVPGAKGKKLILFAPTFRGHVADATTPDFQQFDLKRLREALGEDVFILVKHHQIVRDDFLPKVPEEMDGTFAKDVTGILSIDDLLATADVCISDYSSLIFEYSLFEKPMLFYAYDLEEYFDWRGFYYDFDELTPGPVCHDMDELTDELVHLDERFDAEKVRAFREKFMGSCDGHATERIEELVFGKSLR